MSPANILVTGANRGIGLGLVQHFLKNDEVKRVFATARKPEEATALKAICDPRLTVLQMEVTCDKSIQAAFAEIAKIVGAEGLNLLVNNAGIFVNYDCLEKPNREELRRQLEVNSISPIIITQIFLSLIQKAASRSSIKTLTPSRAAVVNISSIAGSIELNDPKAKTMFQLPTLLAYRMSKSALNSGARVFANELSKEGILVASFCPGWVKTDLGGGQADLTLDESMSQLVPTIFALKDEHNGGYFHNDGKVIPF